MQSEQVLETVPGVISPRSDRETWFDRGELTLMISVGFRSGCLFRKSEGASEWTSPIMTTPRTLKMRLGKV